MQRTDLKNLRREYGQRFLDEKNVDPDPLLQFHAWLEEAIATESIDPTAMVLSTVDSEGHPDARVLLLKGIENGAFIFYSHFNSPKGLQLAHMPYASLLFYWPGMVRQVRIRGVVSQVPADMSDAYFATRPLLSQISACASKQSQIIESRDVLLKEIERLNSEMAPPIKRPEHWGGYQLKPTVMEFWQGRDNRLHDRLQYVCNNQQWSCVRLAP